MRTASALTLLAVCFLSALTVPAADAAENGAAPPALAPGQVLLTRAVPVPAPAFHDAERAGVAWEALLEQSTAAPGAADPAAGRSFQGPDGAAVVWQAEDTPDGRLLLARGDAPVLRYAAFYVDADRWQKATLRVGGAHLLAADVDGAAAALKKDEASGDRTAELTLPRGKHVIVLRSLFAPDNHDDWTISIAIEPGQNAAEGSLALTVSPQRAVDIRDVLDAPRLSGAEVSPDGELVALTIGEYRNGKDRETWLEVRRVSDGRLVRLWRGAGAPSRAVWRPGGRTLTWQVDNGGKSTLHTENLETGETAVVLADVENLGAWAWAPDGQSLVYEISRKPEDDPRKVKRVATPQDRQPWFRGRSHLMQVFVPGGFTRRLTAGPLTPQGWALSPDGKQMVFALSEPDITNRPFDTNELWLMDMSTLATEKLLSEPWLGGVTWSPDGKQLCLQGSPSMFDELGRRLPDGVQANDYGGQLYLFDLQTRQPTALTLDFTPDVGAVAWSRADGHIYATVTETQYTNVYRLRPGRGDWERVDAGPEVVDQFAVAPDARVAVARGSGSTQPNQVFAVDLKKNRARLLLDPCADAYRDVEFGLVQDYVATLPDGQQLDGFVYYPPDFDATRTYPVIVYYYGGTAPIDRTYGGRYPKNVWAGQGYVVYVPNPSGATGYGQEFAARHVNDWGKLTAAEVIAGTTAFLADHPFADPRHVGCIGASYGGFLTQYVVTQTDMFAAAVSHAGISSISSYWGEGYWGYLYGARALANAYPWQDRELYIEQSPLFHADRITTPLLLLHGDSDTNVPVGESDQLYTALKILGRPVEYVQVQGQDHHILDHEQRMVWNDTILAYFARYLKDDPAWWDALYPAPTDY